MTYTGNPSLSREAQQRVLDTFGQTLDLADEGSRQEALLGCDFVLRMDPRFEPARTLQERLRSSAGAIVDTGDLRNALSRAAILPDAEPEAPIVPAELFADLDGLGLELPDLPPASGADLHAELQELLDQRRFDELMALAHKARASIMADPVLQGVVQEAQSRMEAEPYVQKFLAKARIALQDGNSEEVGKILDKVRALDGSHPGLAELEAASRHADALGGFDLFDSPAIDLGSPLREMPMAGLDPSLLGDGGGGSAAAAHEESDPRIRALLDEGQKAFDAGDLQGSIDAWSRIFLIDIDHQEASRRIDHARKLKAEKERQVEEIFHDGVGRLEANDPAGARQAFERVVELQPGNLAAREYLQQLEAGKMPVLTRTPTRDALAGAPEALLQHGVEPVDELKEEILVPPEPGEESRSRAADRRPAKVAAVRERRSGKLFAVVGSLVLAAVLGGGWFVWQNRDRFFPNSHPEDTAVPAPANDPFVRANALHKEGKTASAISQLRRLPASDPRYQQAQDLIKQWQAGAPPEAAAAPTPAAPAAPPVDLERQATLDAARQAFAEGSYMKVVDILQQAADTGRLDPGDADLLARAKEQIEPLTKQIELFRQHEWDMVLPQLWRLREKSPSRDVDRMLIDSYYNLGVRDLQRSDAGKAAEKLKEALNLAPNDAAIRRHLQFAQTYQERQKDLLYRIYVKYLTYR
jgi:tetratricopeptide (TPR) repeat protein